MALTQLFLTFLSARILIKVKKIKTIQMQVMDALVLLSYPDPNEPYVFFTDKRNGYIGI